MTSPRLAAWCQRARYHEYRGHRVAYWEAGEGAPLLLIHGFPTAAWDWHRVWEELGARFRVVAMDMLGFGISDKPDPYDYSILDQADWVESLVHALGITEAHVMAHDYGDTVAQELLARHNRGVGPLSLASLLLLNGGLFPETHRPLLIQKLLLSPLGSWVGRCTNERIFRSRFSSVFAVSPTPEELGEFWWLVEYNAGRRVTHRLIRYMSERVQYRERWVGALVDTPVPVRLVNGPLDPISGRPMTDRYRELVAGSDIITLRGIGHYPQLEDPRGVLRAHAEFLAEKRAC